MGPLIAAREDMSMACIPTVLLEIAVLSPSVLAQADRKESLPDELKGLEIEPEVGTQLNLDLEFVDERGRKKKLGDFFDGKHRLIVTLGYYKRPMLCDFVLNEMVEAREGLIDARRQGTSFIHFAFRQPPQYEKTHNPRRRGRGSPAAQRGEGWLHGRAER